MPREESLTSNLRKKKQPAGFARRAASKSLLEADPSTHANGTGVLDLVDLSGRTGAVFPGAVAGRCRVALALHDCVGVQRVEEIHREGDVCLSEERHRFLQPKIELAQ